jgi:rhodanese-related sulfurtransferase
MKKLPRHSAYLLLPVIAGLFAVLSNALASPKRHLAWMGRPVEILSPVTQTPAQVPQAAPPDSGQPKTASPSPQKAKEATPESRPPEIAPSQPYREITSEEALAYFQSGTPFLDARSSQDFETGHIAGAWSLPVWESDLDIRLTTFEAQSGAESKSPLVLYCTGGECQDSHMLASKLLPLGYRNLLIYRDGYHDWARHGRPSRTGSAR